jgi:adenylosuccinate lyase
MLQRYIRKGSPISKIWPANEEYKFRMWLLVELTVLQVRSELGEIPISISKDQIDELVKDIVIDPKEIDRIEREVTKHDVLAFLMHVSPQLPEYLRPWLHQKMTSYDPGDTGLSLMLAQSVDELIVGVKYVMSILKQRAYEFKLTPMVGRTHGIHAEPITFGVKIANWYDEMKRNLERLIRLRHQVAVGKISGAVGMYTIDPRVEEMVCKKLGLRPIVTTQVISRDIISEFCTTIAILAGTLGKMCTTLRGLTRTEIREVMEFFDRMQRGSSAMPHKKNPISWENITGMCRYIASLVMVAFQDQITWDERDLTNSAPERLILPETSVYMDYVLYRFTESFKKMLVFPEQMKENLDLMKGLVYSQDVQSLVAAKSGLPREEAYGLVREVVLRCWDNNFKLDFFDELRKDSAIMQYISVSELGNCFSLVEKIKYANHIFWRVFEENEEA